MQSRESGERGSEEAGIASTIGFFNIESWAIDHSFEAITNGDQIESDFNRIPSGDSFHYLIGLGEPDEENGNVDFEIIFVSYEHKTRQQQLYKNFTVNIFNIKIIVSCLLNLESARR